MNDRCDPSSRQRQLNWVNKAAAWGMYAGPKEIEGQTSVEKEGGGNLTVDSEGLKLEPFNHCQDSGLYSLSYIKNHKGNKTWPFLDNKVKIQTMEIKAWDVL